MPALQWASVSSSGTQPREGSGCGWTQPLLWTLGPSGGHLLSTCQALGEQEGAPQLGASAKKVAAYQVCPWWDPSPAQQCLIGRG